MIGVWAVFSRFAAVLALNVCLSSKSRLMVNPYRSAEQSAPAREELASARKPVSLCVLLLLLITTVVLGTINVLQEDPNEGARPGVSSITMTSLMIGFLSGLSQVPGLFIAGWRWRSKTHSMLPMLVVAYVIAFTGVLGFAGFVSQTSPSDSMNSAAHMHIFFFPMLHCIMAAILYAVSFMGTIGMVLYTRYWRSKVSG